MPDCRVDVVLVVDESTSVGLSNFTVLKTFLQQFVGGLDVDSGNTQVGLFKFSSAVNTGGAFNLNDYSSVAAVQSAINALAYDGGRTNLAAALAYARTDMLTAAAGDRPDVPNVVIVLTDGKSNVNPFQVPVSTVWMLNDDKTSLFQKLSRTCVVSDGCMLYRNLDIIIKQCVQCVPKK